MEAAGTSRNPYFAGHGVAIDDDLAAVGKLDFQHTASRQFEVDIAIERLECRLDPGHCCIRQGTEFLVIHRDTIPLFADSAPKNVQNRCPDNCPEPCCLWHERPS